MYLYLENDFILKFNNVIGIFDLDNTTVSKNARNMLRKRQEKGQIINLAIDLPKSFIVYKDKNKELIYISQFSAKTIKNRMSKVNGKEKL
jgi:hypothetical protein